MATIKSFTDLSQSKKLAEILPLESADMVYFGIHQGMDGKYYLSGTNTEEEVVPIYKNLCTKVFAKTTASDVINQLPCWSLAALLGVLPILERKGYQKTKPRLLYNVAINKWIVDSHVYTTDAYDNPVDACYKFILTLHELKKL